MQGFVREGHGEDHLSVAVEFEDDETSDHPSTTKEVQLLTLEFGGKLEKWQIVVSVGQGDTSEAEIYWRFLKPGASAIYVYMDGD
jgi:hypothetical protein